MAIEQKDNLSAPSVSGVSSKYVFSVLQFPKIRNIKIYRSSFWSTCFFVGWATGSASRQLVVWVGGWVLGGSPFTLYIPMEWIGHSRPKTSGSPLVQTRKVS